MLKNMIFDTAKLLINILSYKYKKTHLLSIIFIFININNCKSVFYRNKIELFVKYFIKK